MAETKTPVERKERDLVLPIVLGASTLAIGVGVYMYLKKPAGSVPQGSDAKASFKFNYQGEGGNYILQVSLGKVTVFGTFDHVEGFTWTKNITLPGPDEYEFTIFLDLPAAISPDTYDGEALIRLPGSDWLDYVEGGKLVTKSALMITEG